MRVLFMVPGYPSPEKPSYFPFFKEQVKILVKDTEKYDIDVLYVEMLPTRKLLSRYSKKFEVTNDGLTDIYKCKIKTFSEKDFPWINSVFYYRRMKKLFKYYIEHKGTPDIIYAHFTHYAGWAAAKIGKEYNIPVVVQEHSGELLCDKIKCRKIKMLKFTLKNSTGVYCVSKKLAESVKQHTGWLAAPEIIPNVIGRQFGYCEPKERERFVFLAAGHLYKGKRMEMLVEAFCEAFPQNDNVELRICGEGECRRNIETIIKNNNRQNQVILCGNLKQRQLIEEYKNCNAFVLPSEHETFGIVYREAMAIGRPIITTNHGGFSEGEFNKSMGIMIDVDSKEQLVEALMQMRESSESYDYKKISETMDAYSENVIKKALDEIFDKSVKK